jgi:hypothetical protein
MSLAEEIYLSWGAGLLVTVYIKSRLVLLGAMEDSPLSLPRAQMHVNLRMKRGVKDFYLP